ncbi:hypothetical protein GBA52_026449 [Prunus armeniaca]|nr:hypothetical protein GBA52_026449 [Prunus armeniaca]
MACWMALLDIYEVKGRKEEALQMMAFVLWRIWKCRNALVFTGVLVNPGEAVAMLLKQVDEFNEVQAAKHIHMSQQGAPSESSGAAGPVWASPPPGLVKLNCDGAWEAQTGRGGVGWVLRDGIGCFISAGGYGDLRCASVLMAEAEAIREGLTRCLEVGFDKVAVESDSLGLIKMLNQEVAVNLEIEGILFDIQCLIQSVNRVEFLYAPRLCNQAAHKVAAHAFRSGGRHSWDLVCPEWLFNCLAHDVNCSIRL